MNRKQILKQNIVHYIFVFSFRVKHFSLLELILYLLLLCILGTKEMF
jgi:hypothetical protein